MPSRPSPLFKALKSLVALGLVMVMGVAAVVLGSYIVVGLIFSALEPTPSPRSIDVVYEQHTGLPFPESATVLTGANPRRSMGSDGLYFVMFNADPVDVAAIEASPPIPGDWQAGPVRQDFAEFRGYSKLRSLMSRKTIRYIVQESRPFQYEFIIIDQEQNQVVYGNAKT